MNHLCKTVPNWPFPLYVPPEEKQSMKTYQCRCGHLAYKLPRREWLCHCSNPAPKNPPAKMSDKGIIKPEEINVARMLRDIECRGD